MRFPGVSRLREEQRRLSEGTGGRALILLYHRVEDLQSDPQLLAVSKEHFDEHMALLSSEYRTLRLTELIEALMRCSVPDHTVAVTFDEGYADNLLNAKGILERHRVPATVFVSSGYVGQDREYWWDELERVLLQPGVLPEKLTLNLGGDPFTASISSSTTYSVEDQQRDAEWSVLQEDATPRHRLYRALCDLLRPLPVRVRDSALEQIRDWAGCRPTARKSHRPLSVGELRELIAGGLVEVGAHTVNHPLLSAQPVEEQRSEIVDSKVDLERLCECCAATFSYPFGGRAHYSAHSVECVRRAGFSGACSAIVGRVRSRTDPFQLPRCLVRDCDLSTFQENLERWFSGRA
jgi:peptidoglycan/xylan/chitin deacetylase (PgdA/CDA1 family)